MGDSVFSSIRIIHIRQTRSISILFDPRKCHSNTRSNSNHESAFGNTVNKTHTADLFPKALRRVPRQKASALHTLPHLHHYTYTAHLHTTTLTPLTCTAPQHLHTSPYTYTAHLHCATAFAHIAPHTLHTPLHLHRSPTPRHSICTHRLHIAFYFFF